MNTDNLNIWAFAQVPEEARQQLHLAVQNGKSRFGCWGTGDLRKNWNGELKFLLSIKPGDWIVHVNLPTGGDCVAVVASGVYEFDEGIRCNWGNDFCHYIPVDPKTIVPFRRNNPNVLTSVNLRPRSRYQRVLAKEDFLKSIENLKANRVTLKSGETREAVHLRDKAGPILAQITTLLHETHHGKNLERFFAQVFRKMPGVQVIENGFGWRTDDGADLILTVPSTFRDFQFERTIVVQVKSYAGKHYDLSGVNQIVHAIKHFSADAGMIITTADSTEQLQEEISKQAAALGKPIDLLAGKDVARFVIENNPSLLFGTK